MNAILIVCPQKVQADDTNTVFKYSYKSFHNVPMYSLPLMFWSAFQKLKNDLPNYGVIEWMNKSTLGLIQRDRQKRM